MTTELTATELFELTSEELNQLVKDVEANFCSLNLTEKQAEENGQLRKAALAELKARS